MCTKRSSIGIEAPEYPYTEGLLLQQLFMKLLLLCPTTAVAALASCVLAVQELNSDQAASDCVSETGSASWESPSMTICAS